MRLAIAALIAGVFAGFFFTRQHYVSALREIELSRLSATLEAGKVIQTLSKEYYELHQDAANREPTTVPERVLVKAKCPVREAGNAGMGNGTDAVRVELDRGVVAGIAGVGDRHKMLYEKCAAKLRFHQEAARNDQ